MNRWRRVVNSHYSPTNLNEHLANRHQKSNLDLDPEAYDLDNDPLVLPRIVGIAAGANHTLLLDENGFVWSFGDNQ